MLFDLFDSMTDTSLVNFDNHTQGFAVETYLQIEQDDARVGLGSRSGR